MVGDAKVYAVLQSIRTEYGDNVKWLIFITGDWHIMYNNHKVLMKPYADAGLMDLAKISGYRSETLTSLRTATNFRRTHLFILQCFEAFNRYFLTIFYENQLEDSNLPLTIQGLLSHFQKIKNNSSLADFRASTSPTIIQNVSSNLQKFVEFLDEKLQSRTV